MTKKYVITDPCYILPESEWDKCIEYAEKTSKEDKVDWSYIFRMAVEMALTKFTNGNSWVESTGFGDWTNEMDFNRDCSPNNQVKAENELCFCADSGMVCVCELTPEAEARLNGYPNKMLAAIFSMPDTYQAQVNFDRSNRDWTVVSVKFKDPETGEYHCVKSTECEGNEDND